MTRPSPSTRQLSSRRATWAGLFAIGLSLALLGCDTSVNAVETPKHPFSIVGVLDAGRDTQFVRVADVGDSMAYGGPAEPLDATVESEHLASGRTTVWRDSLFRMRQVREEGVEEMRWVHNFWTTASFEPGETYRFTVADAEGRASTVAVTLPDAASDVEIVPPGSFSPAWGIRVQGAARLADVVIVLREERSSGADRTTRFSVVADTVRRGPESFSIAVPASEVRERLRGGPAVGVVRVTAAGPDWPDVGGLEEDMLLTPGVISNVENGYGYLGGVATRTVPFCGAGTPSLC